MPKITIRMERNLGRDHGIGELCCAVADPEEGPGGPAPPPYCYSKLRPEGPKKFFETPPTLSQGLDDRPPSLSEGLDPPL